MIDRLIELHQVDWSRAAGLAALGKGEGYVGHRFRAGPIVSRARARPDVPDFLQAMAWIRRYMPSRDVATA